MGAQCSRNGHTHGLGAQSFITPYESSTHAQQTNTPLRVSTVTAKRRQGRKQRLPLFLNSDRSNGLSMSCRLSNATPTRIVRFSWAARSGMCLWREFARWRNLETQSTFTLSAKANIETPAKRIR